MLISFRKFAAVALLCTSTCGWCSNASGTSHKKHHHQPPASQQAVADTTQSTQPAPGPFHAAFVKNIWTDQKAIWSSPFHAHAADARWIAPLGLMTAGLVATDEDAMRHVSAAPDRLSLSRHAGDFGVAAMIGTAGTMYLWGSATGSDHSRETGLLASEALIDSAVVAETLKFATQRPRPIADNGRGQFWNGGASFPSEHAMAAWTVAAVIAQEYPGTLTKLLAYGAASGVSLSRVAGREHFPSDVFIGSTLGWLIGHQVYRGHHDPKLGGATWGTFEKSPSQFVRPPAEFGSPYVPLDSWIYPAFDRLSALGYVPTSFAGLRPWTRMDCARLLDEASDLLAGDDRRTSEPYRLLLTLRKEFSPELDRMRGSASSEVALESVYTRYTGISGVPLDDGYHFGQTLVNDYGRPYGQGSNAITGASGWAAAGPVTFYVRGEYQHAAALPAYSASVQQLIGAVDQTVPQMPVHTTAIDRAQLLDAYAAFNFKSVQLSVGRQSLWWGPGVSGPPMFSDNAPPLDMVRLTKTSPWQLPGFLGWLGPMRWDAFFGLMADHRYPADPAIHGEKVSFKPTPNLEFGFSRTVVFRPVTARKFWKSFISVDSSADSIPGTPADVGDRHGGFDFSYRIPGLRNWLVLYNDALTDDDPSPLSAPQRSIMNPGIYLPRIPGIAKLDFRAEAVYSDPPSIVDRDGHFFYWNGAYHDSYTNGGKLLGSWVGRQGRGVQLWSTYWLSPRNSLQVGYRDARVDREFIPSGGRIQDVKVRTTFVAGSGVDISAFVQHERWTFPVLSPGTQSDTTASIQITFRPMWGRLISTHN